METIRLSGVAQDNFFNNPVEAAPLQGIEDIHLGTGITFKPYGAVRHPGLRPSRRRPGLRVGRRLRHLQELSRPASAAPSATTPIFAGGPRSTRGRINLNSLPLFFPEKRTFFLEGSQIFKLRDDGR